MSIALSRTRPARRRRRQEPATTATQEDVRCEGKDGELEREEL